MAEPMDRNDDAGHMDDSDLPRDAQDPAEMQPDLPDTDMDRE